MLDWYLGECMVSMINISNGIKKSTHVHQNCNTNQKLIIGGYVKVRESLYTRVMIWINTKLNQFDTRASLPRYAGLCMVHRPNWYRN